MPLKPLDYYRLVYPTSSTTFTRLDALSNDSLIEADILADALLTEDGQPILTEDGQVLTVE
jgi:hypothetical protein